MKKKVMLLSNRSILAVAVSAVLITSCSKVDELRRNPRPNSTVETPPSAPTDSVTQPIGSTELKPFSLTEIAYSNPDFNNPGRGAEQWHGAIDVNVPIEGTSTTPYDVYHRFVWTRLEGATQGSYNWGYFDGLVNAAIQKKQKMSFGIMSAYPDGDAGTGCQSFDGGYAAYPQYLHALMQSESVKDWRTGSTWTPNYNSPNYLNRLLALHQALNSHIETASYNGVAYKDVIQFIDIRGYGSWGEWNSSSIVNHTDEYPAGTFPTITTFKKIVDAHTQGFPNFPLVAMIAAFDGNRLGVINNPPEIGHYILTTKNNWGPVGWRRDQWGATDSYLKDYLEFNNTTYNGVVFKD